MGFAASTDFWGIPRAVEAFIEGLPRQNSKPAFVFNTFSAASGKALRILTETVATRDFRCSCRSLAANAGKLPSHDRWWNGRS
jgi:hypothetical protein